MVSDTLQIAICGDMPDMTGRLACREDIRYCLFQDSWVLRDRLLDDQAEPIDLALVESAGGAGLYPLYFRTARDDCPVLLVTDTISEADMEPVTEQIDRLLYEKRQRRQWERTRRRAERENILAFDPEAEMIDRDGAPGLRLGNMELFAKNPVEAWLLRTLRDGELRLDDLRARMIREVMPEINRYFSELWRNWDDEEPPVVEKMRQRFSEESLEPEVTLAGLSIAVFIESFSGFLAREDVG